MEPKPLVSPQLAMVAVALGGFCCSAGIFLSGNAMLPAWLPITVWGLGAFALWLAGKAAPAFPVLGPVVPLWLVPMLGALGIALGGFAASLPPGRLQSCLLLVASVVTYLSGKAAPPDREPAGVVLPLKR